MKLSLVIIKCRTAYKDIKIFLQKYLINYLKIF